VHPLFVIPTGAGAGALAEAPAERRDLLTALQGDEEIPPLRFAPVGMTKKERWLRSGLDDKKKAKASLPMTSWVNK
jgi:hypothetical protein